ncbi:MAG TPA: hypothetical protein EYP36_05090 [Calditrichaeota bacterium]|nr:hypothetical protein [Calditrichota bacterium]
MDNPNTKQQKFIHEWALSGKSLYTLANELNVNVLDLMGWADEFEEEIRTLKAQEYDRIQTENQMTKLKQYNYYASLYTRLKSELDKRDFSGLPTDKLYFILNDTLKQAHLIKSMDLADFTDSDDLYDDWLDEEKDDY